MEERVASSVGAQRFYATLIAIFAAVALVLSAVGLYGVIAYAVSQRTHELGVRVALGATADRISRMVISEGLTLTAVGAVHWHRSIALAMGRVVASLLFGVIGARSGDARGVVACSALSRRWRAGCRHAAPRASIRSPRCAATNVYRVKDSLDFRLVVRRSRAAARSHSTRAAARRPQPLRSATLMPWSRVSKARWVRRMKRSPSVSAIS